ncbi:MAG: hypothetical protein MJZ74_07405 [Muribaculaceae bacterium]|nr:hypothetical protein [Muribaculaceae bacterium]
MKHLLLTLLAFISISMLAADYVPMIEEGKTWHYYFLPDEHEMECLEPPFPHYLTDVTIQGDSIIDGKTYKKVYSYGYDPTYEEDKSTWELVALLRENDKVVYAYADASSDAFNIQECAYQYLTHDQDTWKGEVVIYDFNQYQKGVGVTKTYDITDRLGHKYKRYDTLEGGLWNVTEGVGIQGNPSMFYLPLKDWVLCASDAMLCNITNADGEVIYVHHHAVEGDINDDGVVDIQDVQEIAGVVGDNANYEGNDITYDGIVDIDDINWVINYLLGKAYDHWYE